MCSLFLFWIVALVVGLLGWLVVLSGLRRYLAGPDLARYDAPVAGQVGQRDVPSPGHADVVAMLENFQDRDRSAGGLKAGIQRIRKVMDEEFGKTVEQLDGVTVTEGVDAEGVSAEWVVPEGWDEGARPQQRMLYIHGGAFVAGSPRSHRGLVAELAKALGCAVLSIDYRLVPEHSRRDCAEDCRKAYQWLRTNAPGGGAAPDAESLVLIAGDSAGGNLSLVTAAWSRSEEAAGLAAADGVIAFSPATDGTLGSPSLLSNVPTDPMLGRMFAFAARFRLGGLLFGWAYNRMLPRHPMLSPIHGDLSDLPPTLVQASEAECLIDDARRYVNKAQAAGSPVTLQTWPFMVHVFQVFSDRLEEGRQAIDRVAAFVDEVVQQRTADE